MVRPRLCWSITYKKTIQNLKRLLSIPWTTLIHTYILVNSLFIPRSSSYFRCFRANRLWFIFKYAFLYSLSIRGFQKSLSLFPSAVWVILQLGKTASLLSFVFLFPPILSTMLHKLLRRNIVFRMNAQLCSLQIPARVWTNMPWNSL